VTDYATLAELGVATVHEAAGRTGVIDVPLTQVVAGSRVAGPARIALCAAGDNSMVHAVIAHALPGDVLVLTSREPAPVALVGELLATQAQAQGVAGILVDGAVRSRPGDIGPPIDPAVTTKIVEFNDLDALEAALAPGDVACVLAEPALTNIGIVAPDPGYHDALREITRRTGTLLVIDETHTICVGPGGATRAWGLDPDFFVIGKPIAGGMPAAAFGMTPEGALHYLIGAVETEAAAFANV